MKLIIHTPYSNIAFFNVQYFILHFSVSGETLEVEVSELTQGLNVR